MRRTADDHLRDIVSIILQCVQDLLCVQLLDPIETLRKLGIEPTTLQCLSIRVPDAIVCKQVMTILMGCKPLNAEGPQHSARHTPRDFIAGIDENPLEIRMSQTLIVMICYNRHPQWAAIPSCSRFADIRDIGLIRLG